MIGSAGTVYRPETEILAKEKMLRTLCEDQKQTLNSSQLTTIMLELVVAKQMTNTTNVY